MKYDDYRGSVPGRGRAVGRLAALVLIALLATGCTTDAREPAPTATAGVTVQYIAETSPVVIEVQNPTPVDNVSRCLDQDSVAQSLQTADLPTSRVVATLVDGASLADVQAIVDCLQDSLDSAQIVVSAAEADSE